MVNLPLAIIAGCVGTAVMAVATGFLGVDIMASLGAAFGGHPYLLGGPMHFGIGIAYALLYARVFTRRLWGPPWLRGLQFSFLPWLIALLVAPVVPVAHLFGSQLSGTTILSRGVQLLPDWAVSLVTHLVYGTVLGWLYDPGEDG
ncbi:MAG: hypothetical protein ACE5I9_06070 [Candidatus Methylomirabilales bacterium]